MNGSQGNATEGRKHRTYWNVENLDIYTTSGESTQTSVLCLEQMITFACLFYF